MGIFFKTTLILPLVLLITFFWNKYNATSRFKNELGYKTILLGNLEMYHQQLSIKTDGEIAKEHTKKLMNEVIRSPLDKMYKNKEDSLLRDWFGLKASNNEESKKTSSTQ